MCTVTFIPTKKGFVLTFSRDEAAQRQAEPPRLHANKLIYPNDSRSGGTWIAVSQHQLVFLVNGDLTHSKAVKDHQLSRGILVLKVSKRSETIWSMKEKYLKDTAPFTMTTIDFEDLRYAYRLSWNGKTKYIDRQSIDLPQIWSSSTLYNQYQQLLRKTWFEAWCEKHAKHRDHNVAAFHRHTFTNNNAVDLLVKHPSGVQTTSITRVEYEQGKISIEYEDLIEKEKHMLTA